MNLYLCAGTNNRLCNWVRERFGRGNALVSPSTSGAISETNSVSSSSSGGGSPSDETVSIATSVAGESTSTGYCTPYPGSGYNSQDSSVDTSFDGCFVKISDLKTELTEILEELQGNDNIIEYGINDFIEKSIEILDKVEEYLSENVDNLSSNSFQSRYKRRS